ncbi:MAG: methylmalonyl-CoA mutase family protein [Desulfobacterales bacterium]|nr:methylmalonyl-CoA mutase family protein [Desulfobacterales bacterium]
MRGEEMDQVKKAHDEWERKIEEAGTKERKTQFLTRSRIPVKRVYTPLDLEKAGFDYVKELNFPGEYPYTRGIDPLMYREKLWLIGQYGGFGSAEETNKRFKYLLSQGITAFTLALDLPTQMGYDSDHPMSKGEVGKTGVAVDSLRDMEIIYEGIPLNAVQIVGTLANAIPTIGLSWFMALAEKQKVSPASFVGFLQNEILKEYVARGAYFLPVSAGIKLNIDVLEYCAQHLPTWLPIQLCGYHFREAGASAVQEIAFTLADAITYIEETLKRGLQVDDFVPQFVFFFSANLDLFEEVAKFRALRRIWARLMKERFGAKNPRSLRAMFHIYTGGSNLTAQQPMNNIVRVTAAALAAVLGGVQHAFLSSLDEPFQTPSEESALLAIRTQQILAHELGLTNTVDPLGGSYYVESLTGEIEEKVLDYLKRIESMGGAVAAIEKGFYQSEIAASAYQFQEEINKKERIVVGVNEYRIEEQVKIKPLKYDPKAEKKVLLGLKQFKKERSGAILKKALDGVKRAAERNENMVQPTFEAVKAYATVGEISDALRAVHGEFIEGKSYF